MSIFKDAVLCLLMLSGVFVCVVTFGVIMYISIETAKLLLMSIGVM